MAKRKKHNSNIKNILIGVLIVAVCMSVLTFPIISHYYEMNKGWVMKVDSSKTSEGEFKLNAVQLLNTYQYFYGPGFWTKMTAEEFNNFIGSVKSGAIEASTYDEICAAEAKTLGLALTEEDKATAAENFENLKSELTSEIFEFIGMRESSYIKYMEKVQLAENYRDYVHGLYVFTQTEYDTYFEDYYPKNYTTINTLMADFILVADAETAETMKAALENGDDIAELIAEFDVNKDTRTSPEPVKISKGGDYSDETVDELFTLLADAVAGPYEVAEKGFVVFKLAEKTIRDKEEVKIETIETYNDEQKKVVFDAEYAKAIESYKISYNPTLIGAMKLISN